MPPGPPLPERGVPGRLARLNALPQREVSDVLLFNVHSIRSVTFSSSILLRLVANFVQRNQLAVAETPASELLRVEVHGPWREDNLHD